MMQFDFENVFHTHYGAIARAIVRVVRDSARAEEIAAETFWKSWRNPKAAQIGQAVGGCTGLRFGWRWTT